MIDILARIIPVLLLAWALYTCLHTFFKPVHTVKRPPQPLQGKELIGVALVALASRGILALISMAYLGDGTGLAPLSECWERWDAHHYLWIAEHGYQAVTPDDGHLYIVFYPLYPALVALAGGGFTGAMIVSWGSLAGAAMAIYALARRFMERGAAWWAVVFLLVFPTSVFLGAPYTESLFLLTTTLCLLALEQRRWALAGLAGLAGLLAALTRNVGLLLVVPYGVTFLVHFQLLGPGWKSRWRAFPRHFLRHGLWALLIPLGMGIYLFINWKVYGDAWAFAQIQRDHWHQALGFFGNTVSMILGQFLGAQGGNKWYLWGAQLAAITLCLTTLPFWIKKLNLPQGAYTLVYVTVILSPTWLLSFPRYLMGLVPLYIALAQIFGRRRWAWLGILLALALVAAMLWMTLGFLRWEQVL